MATEKHGVIGTSMLHADERAAVESLIALCNQHEQIQLMFNLEPADADEPTTPPTDLFLAYDHGTLIGFARLDGFMEPELCGVVHPEYRRKGVGTLLLAAAQAECTRRGIQDLLMICDEAGESGRAFVGGIGGEFRYAEYRMRLDPTAIDRSRPRYPNLVLRPATSADLDVLVRLQAAAFGDPADEVRKHVSHGLDLTNRQYFLGLLDEEPVGILRLGRYESEADITAFGVLPELQGRGYGRQMLLDAIDLLLAEGWAQIMIDVVMENRSALKLYQSCGFREVTTYGFYHLGL